MIANVNTVNYLKSKNQAVKVHIILVDNFSLTVRDVPVFTARFVFGSAELPEKVERYRERFRILGLLSEVVSGRLVSLEQVAGIAKGVTKLSDGSKL